MWFGSYDDHAVSGPVNGREGGWYDLSAETPPPCSPVPLGEVAHDEPKSKNATTRGWKDKMKNASTRGWQEKLALSVVGHLASAAAGTVATPPRKAHTSRDLQSPGWQEELAKSLVSNLAAAASPSTPPAAASTLASTCNTGTTSRVSGLSFDSYLPPHAFTPEAEGSKTLSSQAGPRAEPQTMSQKTIEWSTPILVGQSLYSASAADVSKFTFPPTPQGRRAMANSCTHDLGDVILRGRDTGIRSNES
jgi:hypothetical protein